MIYLDANVIIRLFEGDAATVAGLAAVIDQYDRFATSTISLIECRCKPMRVRNHNLLEVYDNFFASDRVEVLPINSDVIDQATRLRAGHNLKTPDAIHAASAMCCGAAVLASADAGFTRVPGLRTVVV